MMRLRIECYVERHNVAPLQYLVKSHIPGRGFGTAVVRHYVAAKSLQSVQNGCANVSRPDDPNGFGPNWSNVDDYDIPTVLRKQMD